MNGKNVIAEGYSREFLSQIQILCYIVFLNPMLTISAKFEGL